MAKRKSIFDRYTYTQLQEFKREYIRTKEMYVKRGMHLDIARIAAGAAIGI